MPDPATGRPVSLSPLVTRVLAANPSPFTFTGTQTHLVGTSDLAVIDPGPEDAGHLAALLAVIGDRPVRAILVTHHHRDHSPASRPLQAATGAPFVGASPEVRGGDGGPDAAFDLLYTPDQVLAEGDVLSGAGWTLNAIATPGHASNHLAFVLPEEQALFSGDHVMGWSTSVIAPPDGDMSEYLASLEKLLPRDDRIFYPAHGEPVENPQRLVRGMIGHRKQREGQIVRRIAKMPSTVASLTHEMYVGLDPRLIPAAQQSVLAHLIDLARRGLAREEDALWNGI